MEGRQVSAPSMRATRSARAHFCELGDYPAMKGEDQGHEELIEFRTVLYILFPETVAKGREAGCGALSGC